ncbi:hypothetical protein PILCRDRAFT_804345 [Piloderma croceum F 1598]|uniref:G domain-containing protein n=1 Tax=Piloderma croceum (strain F 1598) TaxID=765440 RepID=A0A0C3EVH9_PILCF|nr:hypothetical protein PILCRDRAFT_804345 [Piloderma croceum F 1598]
MVTSVQPLSENIAECDNTLRKRFKHFRVLILGRANAGKTTILQKVCNTDEQPEIFDSTGKKIDPTIVMPSTNQGAHDIDNEMIFKSNPGFVFHDSRGFESGGDSELRIVKDFIARRARETKLHNQLHAIWYCIPMDDSRPITSAKNSFFSECGTGKVPVIAVFTKMDALDSKAWNELVKQNMSWELAKQRAPEHSLSTAKSLYCEELVPKRYPPKGSVYIRDMNQENIQCVELIQETVSVLGDRNLQLLLVSTQQVSIEICVTYALKECVMPLDVANRKFC